MTRATSPRWLAPIALGVLIIATAAFRGEKNTNWESGWRVPCAVRWPGVVEPGSISNAVVHHMDWMQTFVGEFLSTFQEFPPRMKAAGFSIDQVMEKLTSAGERRRQSHPRAEQEAGPLQEGRLSSTIPSKI